MAFVHAHSTEASKSEMDLFSLLPTQTTIEHGHNVHYKPLGSLTDDGPIEYVVPGHGDEYMDLAHTLLYVKARITKMDGTPLEPGALVGPVNNLLHSLFKRIDVQLNQKLI